MIRVAVGYDPRETVAWHTFVHTLYSKSSMPVCIAPVALANLRGILTRPRHPKQSNDFSFSRFLVPWMFGFDGWVIWLDGDMIIRDDPAKLWALRDDRYAVICVHHEHTPTEDTKYLGNVQTRYPRKNWSSVMLLNCARLRMLTPEYVNTADGLHLHQFGFLPDEQVGWLPRDWNHLVGFDQPNPDAKVVHWTAGGPWFPEFSDAEFSNEWRDALAKVNHRELP